MLKRFWWTAGVLAVTGATLLMLPQTSEAQRRWGGLRGGWGGYRGGYGSGLGGWGGYRGSGLGLGYGGWCYPGFGLGYGGWGYPGFGLGYGSSYGLLGRGWGYGGYSYPSYSGYGYSYPLSSSYGYSYPSYSTYVPSYTYSYFPDFFPDYAVDQIQSAYPVQPAAAADRNAVHIMVVVPHADAQVLFDGQPTQQKGYERDFVTEMAPGTTGVYHITAQWMENGRRHQERRDLHVRPGMWEVVDFNQSPGTVRTTPTNPSVNLNNNQRVVPQTPAGGALQAPTENRVPVNPAVNSGQPFRNNPHNTPNAPATQNPNPVPAPATQTPNPVPPPAANPNTNSPPNPRP